VKDVANPKPYIVIELIPGYIDAQSGLLQTGILYNNLIFSNKIAGLEKVVPDDGIIIIIKSRVTDRFIYDNIYNNKDSKTTHMVFTNCA
jgi:hypothetical protein